MIQVREAKHSAEDFSKHITAAFRRGNDFIGQHNGRSKMVGEDVRVGRRERGKPSLERRNWGNRTWMDDKIPVKTSVSKFDGTPFS